MIADSTKSSIANWYAGKNVLVTGGTGFVGKVIVEKLLRSCPDIKTVYLLIRPKQDTKPQQRFNEYAGQLAFTALREKRPDAFKKLKLVSGDIIHDGLGLSPEDREEVLNNTHVVIHSAATVKFNPMFKEGIVLNVAGTYKVLEVAKEMKQLLSFVHISTSYSQNADTVLEERIYPTDHDPINVMALANLLNDDLMETLRAKMGTKHPNTYTYTKALGEVLVDKYKSSLPIAIVRPSIVVIAKKEPIKGYTEYKYGPNGVALLGAHGIFHAMLSYDDYPTCYVPVDYVANATIVVGCERGRNVERNIMPIYNISESETCINWGDALEIGNTTLLENPFSKMMWLPFGKNYNSETVHLMLSILYHYIPALLIDLMLIIARRKPVMFRLIKKADKGLHEYKQFTMYRWSFKNDALKALHKSLSEADKETFDFDLWNLDWVKYINYYSMALRIFIAKDPIETLPQAREKLKKLKILHQVTKALLILLVVWFAWNYLGYFLNALTFGLERTSSVFLPLKKSI